MISELKPYSDYKDARLPWLASVPKHWELIPNRAIMRNQREAVGDKAKDYTLLSLTLRGVIPRDMENPKGKFPAEFNTYKIVRPQDIIFCLFDVDETPRTVGLANQQGMITGAYDVFTPTPLVNPRFLHYYYLFIDNQKLLKPLYTGLRKTVQRGTFASLKTPCPPLSEQETIVRFLEVANVKINRFVLAKRKLITRLNEQKQAIAHKAITGGLNADVSMKPSGMPWLDSIPKHWNTLRSRYIFREVDERSQAGEETHLSMSQKRGLIPNTELTSRRLLSESYAGAKLCQKGDLILNRLKAHLGVFALAPQSGLVSPDYTVLRPVRQIDSRYFEALYRSPACRVELRRRAKGIVQGFWRLYTDDFYDIRMPVPPVDEQSCIMAYLDGALLQQNMAISRIEREIRLIEEYRVRLTADVVTGRYDVTATRYALTDIGNIGDSLAGAAILGEELLDSDIEDSDE